MFLAAVIFVCILFLTGVGFILVVRKSFKKEVEAAKESALQAQRQSLSATPAQQALIQARAAARREAERQRAERWNNLTPSFVNQAFKSFFRDDAESSFDTSLVNAAFEKFTKEMKAK
jgi:hypothetical protein